MLCSIMTSEIQREEAQDTSETRECGNVKWFNNKAGYGFITATSENRKCDDVFVHHSALSTSEQQYKYLVQGEYVEFNWVESTGNIGHEWQAGNVSGVNGGRLMCETRSISRQNNGEEIRTRKQSRNASGGSRLRGGGPRSVKDENGVEYLLVKRKSN